MTGTRLSGTIWDDSVSLLVDVANNFLVRWGIEVGARWGMNRWSYEAIWSLMKRLVMCAQLVPVPLVGQALQRYPICRSMLFRVLVFLTSKLVKPYMHPLLIPRKPWLVESLAVYTPCTGILDSILVLLAMTTSNCNVVLGSTVCYRSTIHCSDHFSLSSFHAIHVLRRVSLAIS